MIGYIANTSKDYTIWDKRGNVNRVPVPDIIDDSMADSYFAWRTASTINGPWFQKGVTVDETPEVICAAYIAPQDSKEGNPNLKEPSQDMLNSIWISLMNDYSNASGIYPVSRLKKRYKDAPNEYFHSNIGYEYTGFSVQQGLNFVAGRGGLNALQPYNYPNYKSLVNNYILFGYPRVRYSTLNGHKFVLPTLTIGGGTFGFLSSKHSIKDFTDGELLEEMDSDRFCYNVYYLVFCGCSKNVEKSSFYLISCSFNNYNDLIAYYVALKIDSNSIYVSSNGSYLNGDFDTLNKKSTTYKYTLYPAKPLSDIDFVAKDSKSAVTEGNFITVLKGEDANKFRYYPDTKPDGATDKPNLGGGGTAGDITDISGGDNYNGGTQPNTTTVITQTGSGTKNLPKDTISAPNIVNQSYGTSFNIYEVTTPSTFLSALQTDSIWKSFTDVFRGGKPIDSVVNIYNTTISPPTKGHASQLFVGGHELISEYSSATIGANTLPRFQKVGTYTLFSDFFNPYNSFYDQMGDYYIHIPYIGTKRLDAAIYSRGRGITVDGSTESTKYAQLNIYMDFLTGDLFAYTTMDGFVVDQWTGNAASPIPLRREQDGGISATSSLTASGAAIGASIGTIVPGIGNVLGSTLGGAIGASAGIGAASSGAFKSVQADKNIQGNIGFMDTKDIYLTGYLPRFAVPYGYGTMNAGYVS